MSSARSLWLPLGLTVALVSLVPQSGPRRSGPEIVTVAAEYVTATKADVPIPTATDSVAVYQVPAKKRFVLKTVRLPFGVIGTTVSRLAPLGLGQRVDERSSIPKTVYFGDGEAPAHLDPGVEFEPGSVVVIRFSKVITGLAGALFLNGVLEPE